MTKEESDLIITEQNKSTEEILKAVAKVKADYHELCRLKDMRIKELEAQIEKMKCCYNCSKWYDGECEESPKSKTFFCADFKCDKWECE